MRNVPTIAALSIGVLLSCLVAQGLTAVVHTTSIPAGVPADFKQNGNYLYLDLETAAQSTGAGDTNNDPIKTLFSTQQTDCCWGLSSDQGYRWAYRGSGNQSSLSASIYWVNLPAPQAGLWDVYLYHTLNSTQNDTTTLKSITDTFYVGTDYGGSTSQQSLVGQMTLGSATISSRAANPQIYQWDYLGRIALDGSTLDSFRLKMDAAYALERGDTVLMVRLPEPGAAALLAAGGAGLLLWLVGRRKRRLAG
jgi:hypothetical protein